MPFLYATIVLISATIWLIPPIRQFGTRFFFFFLLLGLADAIPLMLMQIYKLTSLPYYLVVSYLLLLALYDKGTLKNKIVLILAVLVPVVMIAFIYPNPAIQRLLFFLLHGLVLLRVIHMMGLDLLKTQALSGYFVVLIFYELLTLIKFFNLLVKVADISVLSNFYIVTGVQITIGIFFIIFKENDRRIRVKLE